MTPEQRLSVFSAQTSDSFVQNTDAVGLLFDMLVKQNEKLEELIKAQGTTHEMLENHMKGEDALIAEFKNAFPAGDPQGHRSYHEALIDQNKQRRDFWAKLTFELTKWGIIGFLGWAVIQLWHGALQGPKV